MNRRPAAKTIYKVVDWLDSMGLSVYGPHMPYGADAGIESPGNMDYDVNDILERWKHVRDDTLMRENI